ncbi:hypothetical protein J1N35_035166 [Gossypium stocksii]|uniref:DUF4283 domain-containing protein n=1 Tax=Gossypium stocksii TaxID=47602 RepID=A0A9D3UTQ8_9ROSI|nr:hypothetical protein J1N35_035166 [Gossypium stocksii]
MGRDEIFFLEEELVQLTVKSSLVVPVNPIERSKIRLVLSPFWIKVGPCLPGCDKKDLMHAIGSTFGGVLRSKVKGDFCWLKIQLDAQKPLRRGIFVSAGNQEKI